MVVSAPEQLEAARVGRVRVDGTDATVRVIALLKGLGPLEGIRAVLVDGAVLGGFNVLDLDAVGRAVGVPVVAVTRRRPDFHGIAQALRKWFPRTASRRLALLKKHPLSPVATGGEPILAAASGCAAADAAWLVRRTTVRGYWPEPLRIAHLVASSWSGPGRSAPPAPRRVGRGGRPRPDPPRRRGRGPGRARR